MQVFNAFMKIFRRSLTSVIVYLVVFVGIVMMIDSMTTPLAVESFRDKKVPVAVMDRDHSEISRAIQEYFAKTQTLVEIGEDRDQLQDAMFFRKVEYLVVIPEGFSASLAGDHEIQLQTTKIPGSNSSIFLDMQLESFLTTYRAYETAGFSPEQALTSTMKILELEAETEVVREDSSAGTIHDFAYFYQLLPYGMMSLMINLIAYCIIEFNKTDLSRRNRCSALPFFRRNLQMLLGGAVIAVLVWGVVIGIGFLMHGKAIVESGLFGWLALNSAAVSLVSICLAYLIGVLAKGKAQISGMCVTITMAFCFLSGVFVDISVMSEGVRKFSQVIPISWYVRANEIIGQAKSISGENQKTILTAVLIQCLFAAAFFTIALAVGRKKNERE